MYDHTWHTDSRSILTAAIGSVKARMLGEMSERVSQEWKDAAGRNGTASALSHLAEAFKLDPFEVQVILLCAGFELDAEFEEATRNCEPGYPTFHMALERFDGASWHAATPGAPLRRWSLVRLDNEEEFLTSRIRLDDRILHFLMGTQAESTSLVGLVERVSLHGADGLSPSQVTVSNQVRMLVQADRSGSVPAIVLRGSDRPDPSSVAARFCRELGLGLLKLDAADLPSTTAERIALARLLEREALLEPGALFIDAHETTAPNWDAVSGFARHYNGLLVVGVGQRAPSIRTENVSFDVGRPTPEERGELWERALEPFEGTFNGSVAKLARQFDVDASSIHAIGERVRWELGRGPVEESDVIGRLWELCGAQSLPQLEALCQRVTSTADWDDLVLPGAQKKTLHDIMIHVDCRFQVYYDWGFAKQNNRGLGITALFSGRSGTGKTLAAEIIANRLNLPLFRTELSSLVSKYIGETEKNLAQIFDAAEKCGAILLFDEADALFGKRSEVKDAHDRYANIEVSYLLQRMEAYSGLAILTTNLKQNLDDAFMRRLRFVVHFPFPGPEERLEIWRRVFPNATPLGDLDHERLAQLNITGGHIKNIAMGAAFQAAHVNESVGLSHILEAARSEYQKLDRTLTSAETRGWF